MQPFLVPQALLSLLACLRWSEPTRAEAASPRKALFGTFSSTTLQSVTSEPAEPLLPEDGEGPSTNSYQPILRDTLPERTRWTDVEKNTWRSRVALTCYFLDYHQLKACPIRANPLLLHIPFGFMLAQQPSIHAETLQHLPTRHVTRYQSLSKDAFQYCSYLPIFAQ